ncbi:hypothetical protein NW841_11945 [Synechococcus sp. H60.3]|uniref:hypothetical protein n=1 Tax=Synechococcus sp. H60.3 TaxID=2967124 RepID=UPI0039C07461
MRRLGPVLAGILQEIYEENIPRLRRWDRQLTNWVYRRGWRVDPSLPKVAIYVLGTVVILAIPILTWAVVVALAAFLAIQMVQKWPQAAPARDRHYLLSADAEDDPDPRQEDWDD